LNTEDALKVLDKVKELNPEILIFFGGEPLVRQDFMVLLRRANELNIPYAVITNGTIPYDYHEFKNVTCSIDILPNNHFTSLKSIDLKSHAGYETLLKAKAQGVPDVCGNIIIHKKSFKYIPELIKHLSSLGIWSIVGYVHSGKSQIWRFRENCPEMLLNEKEAQWISQELLKLKEDPTILLHNVKEYFEGLPKHYNLVGWNCKPPIEYLTIDEDGSIMTCPDVRGIRTQEHRIFDLNLNALQRDWEMDIKGCECYYNHMLQLANSKREDGALVHD
jgi:MoaA/NifB/PqqE/SkfB family radical SAM enzyme